MWVLDTLVSYASVSGTKTLLNGKWVPARPENGKPEFTSVKSRFADAWAVFRGRAEAFTWPEKQ